MSRLVIGHERRERAKLAAKRRVAEDVDLSVDAEAGMSDDELGAFLSAVVDAAIDQLEKEFS